MAFDLDQATRNALADVTYDIRLAVELHESQLRNRMVTMRAAWRNRQLVLERDLRGIAFPSATVDIYRHLRTVK